MSAPGDHVQNPAHIFLGPPPGDWEVVEEALGSYKRVRDEPDGTFTYETPPSMREPLAALARLREREAQTAELYEQKIERIEELEREVKRQEDEKWAAENRADETEAREARLREALAKPWCNNPECTRDDHLVGAARRALSEEPRT